MSALKGTSSWPCEHGLIAHSHTARQEQAHGHVPNMLTVRAVGGIPAVLGLVVDRSQDAHLSNSILTTCQHIV